MESFSTVKLLLVQNCHVRILFLLELGPCLLWACTDPDLVLYTSPAVRGSPVTNVPVTHKLLTGPNTCVQDSPCPLAFISQIQTGCMLSCVKTWDMRASLTTAETLGPVSSEL